MNELDKLRQLADKADSLTVMADTWQYSHKPYGRLFIKQGLLVTRASENAYHTVEIENGMMTISYDIYTKEELKQLHMKECPEDYPLAEAIYED